MKIRIVKCSDGCWYSRLIGEVFDVYVYDDVDYMTKGNRTGLILKSDCEIVKIDTREEAHVQTATKVTMLQEEERQYQKAKEEVKKSCSNCKYHEYFYNELICKECSNVYSNFKPKQQQEDKPKKLKYVYVCKECLGGEPCKLKVYDSTAHPNTCPLEKSRKANWKPKKESEE